MQNNPDVTWTQASAAVLSVFELNLGILCNCLALLKPFVRKHMPRLAFGSSHGSSVQGDKRRNTASPFKPWRGDSATHTYKLQSLDTRNVKDGKKGVFVDNEYQVEFHRKKTNPDASSTEDILPRDLKDERSD